MLVSSCSRRFNFKFTFINEYIIIATILSKILLILTIILRLKRLKWSRNKSFCNFKFQWLQQLNGIKIHIFPTFLILFKITRSSTQIHSRLYPLNFVSLNSFCHSIITSQGRLRPSSKVWIQFPNIPTSKLILLVYKLNKNYLFEGRRLNTAIII